MEEIAAVYARSLFEVAKEQNKLDAVREQIGAFADALDETWLVAGLLGCDQKVHRAYGKKAMRPATRP